MKHEEIKVENQDNLNGVYCPLPLSVTPTPSRRSTLRYGKEHDNPLA